MINPVSPCVRICELDKNDVCIGCFRTSEEIENWIMYSNSEKVKILKLIKKRKDKK